MKIDDDIAAVGDQAGIIAGVDAGDPSAPAADAESKEKVIVRSNGTVTYVGKDIANQFWKFGLLGKDFHYRPFATRMDGATLYASTSDATASTGGVTACPTSATRRAVYNVIDSRQAYLQRAAEAGARRDGLPRAGRPLDALRLRDGRAVARHGARARLHRGGRYRPAVRRGVGPQGPGRQGRRPDRSARSRRRSAEVGQRQPVR